MRILFTSITAILILTGCGNKEEDKPDKISPGEEFTVASIDDAGLKKIISDRRGKVLFINVWATWCAPCIEEFPDIVKTAEHFKGENVDIISLNVDFSSHVDSLVIPFLKRYNARFPVYNVQEKSAEKVINLLNPAWSGAIPATFIYGKNGMQMVFILGSDNFSTFRNSIDSVRSI